MAAKIVKIAYRRGEMFSVYLDGSTAPVFADDAFNQLAVDAAFERRAAVVLELDGVRIHRVQSDVPPSGTAPDPPPRDDVRITRISTQVDGSTGDLIAEIFYEPAAPLKGEKQARTTDRIIHLLCHGAYIANHRVTLELRDIDIVGIVKQVPAERHGHAG